MSECLDCGEEFCEEDLYCYNCGSPTRIDTAGDSETRNIFKGYKKEGGGKSKATLMFVLILLLLLLIISIYISRTVSTLVDGLNSGFY